MNNWPVIEPDNFLILISVTACGRGAGVGAGLGEGPGVGENPGVGEGPGVGVDGMTFGLSFPPCLARARAR